MVYASQYLTDLVSDLTRYISCIGLRELDDLENRGKSDLTPEIKRANAVLQAVQIGIDLQLTGDPTYVFLVGEANWHRANYVYDCASSNVTLASVGVGNGSFVYDTFLKLLDVPKTYLGHAGDIVAVNSTQSGLVFTSGNGYIKNQNSSAQTSANFWIDGNGATASMQVANPPVNPTDVLRLADVPLPDQIISGLGLSIVSINVVVQPGTWRIGGVIYSKGTTTNLAYDAQDATQFRYDTVYADTSNSIHLVSGVLSPTAGTAIQPDVPDNTIPIGYILIAPTSVTTSPVITGFVTVAGPFQNITGKKRFAKPVDIPNYTSAATGVQAMNYNSTQALYTQILAPQLLTTSTAGYVWTATDTSGHGHWAVGSGGGFTLTDGNGTTANGTAVDLGGTLTSDVSIELDNFNFLINSTADPAFGTSIDIGAGNISLIAFDGNLNTGGQLTLSQIISYIESSDAVNGTSGTVSTTLTTAMLGTANSGFSVFKQILIDTAGQGIKVQDTQDLFGMFYDDDYSVNGESSDRWIPDIAAVANLINSLSVTGASNGLTLSSPDIKLGGPLTGNTQIALAGHTFNISDTTPNASLRILSGNQIAISYTNGTTSLAQFEATLANGVIVSFTDTASSHSQQMVFDGSHMIVTDSLNSLGLQYFTDYHTANSSNPRWIPDKAYVDAAISGVGSGTVTAVSVVSANGFSGIVATSTTTPAITLTLQNATSSQSGKLTNTDWSTFNSKVGLDANGNVPVNALVPAMTSTATAAATTTLTITSTQFQLFTGSTTQTVQMPVVSTGGMVIGNSWTIMNRSTGIVTITSSGGNTILALPNGLSATIVCIAITGTTAGSWQAISVTENTVTGSGGNSVLSVGPTLTGTTTVSSVTMSGSINKVSITAPTTSATLAIADGSTLQTTGAFALNLTTTAASTPTFPTGPGTLLYNNGSGSGLSGIPTSVSNSDSTLTITPITGPVVASLNLSNPNNWTGAITTTNTVSVASGTGFGTIIAPTINNSGSGAYNALWVQVFESANGSGNKNLINLGTTTSSLGTFTSKFNISNTGMVTTTNDINQKGTSSGIVTLHAQAVAGTYNWNWPITAGSAGQALVSQGGSTTAMTWATVATVVSSNDITAQTAAGTITSITSASANSTYDVGGYINVTAVTTDVIQAQITYTDENNTAQTISLSSISAIGNNSIGVQTIRVKASTTITLKTNLTTGVGSITFDAGGYIKKAY